MVHSTIKNYLDWCSETKQYPSYQGYIEFTPQDMQAVGKVDFGMAVHAEGYHNAVKSIRGKPTRVWIPDDISEPEDELNEPVDDVKTVENAEVSDAAATEIEAQTAKRVAATDRLWKALAAEKKAREESDKAARCTLRRLALAVLELMED